MENKIGHISIFDSLRGLMAIWVLIAHSLMTFDIQVPSQFAKVFNVAFAVDVFIILSGFVIFLLLDKKRETYRLFIIRRGLRLFPVYLIAIVVSALTIQYQLNTWLLLDSSGGYWNGRTTTLTDSNEYFWQNLIPHIFMLHGLFGSVIPSSDFAFIEPAWSLTLEWQFYLIAPFIFNAIVKRKIYNILVISIGLGATYGMLGSGFLSNQFYLFIVGIFSYWVIKNSKKNTLGPLLIFAVAIIFRDIPSFIWGIFVVLAFYETPKLKFVKQALDNRVMNYLGKISYPIYVIHTLVIFFGIWLYSFLNIPEDYKVSFIVTMTIIVTICLASFLHHYVEEPCINLGKKIR